MITIISSGHGASLARLLEVGSTCELDVYVGPYATDFIGSFTDRAAAMEMLVHMVVLDPRARRH
jgi:hypothetical protein